jgi:hypothetical protein
MKKKLPTDTISSELAQSSVFFSKPEKDKSNDQPSKPHSSLESSRPPEAPTQGEQFKSSNQSLKEEINTDVNHDVMTSLTQDMDFRKWQEIIENTETQNTALRLTNEERYAIEDAVNELRRKYGIKTSMNEVARLGLLLLITDFKKNKKESVIYKVKKA